MPMKDDLTQEKARDSVAEHYEIDELIEILKDTDYSSLACVGHAEKLRERLHHHLDEEEHEVSRWLERSSQRNSKPHYRPDIVN